MLFIQTFYSLNNPEEMHQRFKEKQKTFFLNIDSKKCFLSNKSAY